MYCGVTVQPGCTRDSQSRAPTVIHNPQTRNSGATHAAHAEERRSDPRTFGRKHSEKRRSGHDFGGHCSCITSPVKGVLMRLHIFVLAVATCALLLVASNARAQGQPSENPWVIDFGVGISPSIKGDINSGVIGTFQGQTVAVVPHTYSDVYGNSIDWHFGGGYALNADSEIHGAFIYQSTSANLVRLGDIGPSSLYGQFSDYKSWALDIGYRRYMSITGARVYAEGAIGIADIQRINVVLA